MDYPYIVEGNPDNINIIDAIANKFFNLSTPSPEQGGSNLNEGSGEGRQDEHRSYSPKPTSSTSSQHIIPEARPAEEEGIQWDNSDNLLGEETPSRLSPTAEYDYPTPLDVGDDLLSGLSGVRSYGELEGEAHDGVKFPLMPEPHELQDSDEGPPTLEDTTKTPPPRCSTEESEALGPPPLEPMTISSSDQIAHEIANGKPNLSKHFPKEISSNSDHNYSNNTVPVWNRSIESTEHFIGSNETLKHIVPVSTSISKNHQNDVDPSLGSPLHRFQKKTTDNEGLECSSLASDRARSLQASNEGTGHSFSKNQTPLKSPFNNISAIKSGISPDVPSKEDIELITDFSKSVGSVLNGWALLSPNPEISSPISLEPKNESTNEVIVSKLVLGPSDRPKFEDLAEENTPTKKINKITYTPPSNSSNNNYVAVSRRKLFKKSGVNNNLLNVSEEKQSSNKTHIPTLSVVPRNQVKPGTESSRVDMPDSSNKVIGQNKDTSTSDPCRLRNKKFKVGCDNLCNRIESKATRIELSKETREKGPLMEQFCQKKSNIEENSKCDSGISERWESYTLTNKQKEVDKNLNGQSTDEITKKPKKIIASSVQLKIPLDRINSKLMEAITSMKNELDSSYVPEIEERSPIKTPQSGSNNQRADTSPRTGTTADDIVPDCGSQTQPSAAASRSGGTFGSIEPRKKTEPMNKQNQSSSRLSPIICQTISTNKIHSSDPAYMNEKGRRSLNLPGLLVNPKSKTYNFISRKVSKHSRSINRILDKSNKNRSMDNVHTRDKSLNKNAVLDIGTASTVLSNEHNKSTVSKEVCELSIAESCLSINGSDSSIIDKPDSSSANVDKLQQKKNKTSVSEKDLILNEVSNIKTSRKKSLLASDKKRIQNSSLSHCKNNEEVGFAKENKTLLTVQAADFSFGLSLNFYESIFPNKVPARHNFEVQSTKNQSSGESLVANKNNQNFNTNKEGSLLNPVQSTDKKLRTAQAKDGPLLEPTKKLDQSPVELRSNAELSLQVKTQELRTPMNDESGQPLKSLVMSTTALNEPNSSVKLVSEPSSKGDEEAKAITKTEKTDSVSSTCDVSSFSQNSPRNSIEEFQGCAIIEQNYTKEFCESNKIAVNKASYSGRKSLDSSSKPKHLSDMIKINPEEYPGPDDKSEDHSQSGPSIDMSMAKIISACQKEIIGLQALNSSGEFHGSCLKKHSQISISGAVKFNEEGEHQETAETKTSSSKSKDNYEVYQDCLLSKQNDVPIKNSCGLNKISDNKPSTPKGEFLEVSSSNTKLQSGMMLKTDPEYLPGADDQSDQSHCKPNPDNPHALSKVGSPSKKQEDAIEHKTVGSSRESFVTFYEKLSQSDVHVSGEVKLDAVNIDSSKNVFRELFCCSTEIKTSSKYEALNDELRDCTISKQHDMQLEGQCESNRISGCSSISENEKSLGIGSSSTKQLAEILKINNFEPLAGDQSSCKPTAEISDILPWPRNTKQDEVIDSAREMHETYLEQKRQNETLISDEVNSESANKVTETTSSELGNLISEKEQLVSNKNCKVLKELCDSDKISENDSSVPEGVLQGNNSSDPTMLPDLITLNNEELSATENQSGQANSKETTEICGIDLPMTDTPGETEISSSESGNLLYGNEQLVSKENNKERCKLNKILDNDSPVQEGVPLENNSSETKLLTGLTTLINEELSGTDGQTDQKKIKEITEIACIGLSVAETPGETETTSSQSGNLVSENEPLLCNKNNGVAREFSETDKISDNDSSVKEGVLLGNNSSDPQLLPDMIKFNNEELSATDNQSDQQRSKETTEISDVDLPLILTPGETETTSSQSGCSPPEPRTTHNIETCFVDKKNNDALEKLCESNKDSGSNLSLPESVLLENNSPPHLLDLIKRDTEELAGHINDSNKNNSKPITETFDVNSPLTESENIFSVSVNQTPVVEGSLNNIQEVEVLDINVKACDSRPADGVLLENRSSDPKQDIIKPAPNDLAGPENIAVSLFNKTSSEPMTYDFTLPRTEIPTGPEKSSSKSLNLIPDVDHCKQDDEGPGEYCETQVSSNDSTPPEGALLENNSSDLQMDTIKLAAEQFAGLDNQLDKNSSNCSTETFNSNSPGTETPIELEKVSAKSLNLIPVVEPFLASKQDDKGQVELSDSHEVSGNGSRSSEGVIPQYNSPGLNQALIKLDPDELVGPDNQLDKHSYKSSTITSGFSLCVLETPVDSDKSFLKSVGHLGQNNCKSGIDTFEIKVPVAETPDETRSSSSKSGDLIQEKEVSSAYKQESNPSPVVVKSLDGNFSNPTLHMHVKKIVLEELLEIVDQNSGNSYLKKPMSEPKTIHDSLAKQSFERNVWDPALFCDNKKLIFKELSTVPRESSTSNAHKAEEATPGSDEVKCSPFINNFIVRTPREQNCLSEKYVPNNFSSRLVNRLSTNESLVEPLNQPLNSISKRIQVSSKPSHYQGMKSFYLSMDETGTHTLDPENDDIVSSVVRRNIKPENSLLEKNIARRRKDEFRFRYQENRRVYKNPKRFELTRKNKTKSGTDVQLNQSVDKPKTMIADFSSPVTHIAPKKKNKRLLPPEYEDSVERPSSKLKRFPQNLDEVDNHYDYKDNHYGTKALSIVIKKLEIIQLLKNNGLHTAYVPSSAFDHLVMKDKNNYCSFCSNINDKAVHSIKICKIKKARLERGSSPLQIKCAQRRRQSINENREEGKEFYSNKQEDVPQFPGNPNFMKTVLKGGVPVCEKLSVFHELEEARKRESVEVEQTPWVEKCGFLGFFSCGHGKSFSPQDVTFEGECRRCYEGNRTTYCQRYTRMKEQYPFLNDDPSDSLIDNNRLHLIPRDFSEDSSMSSDEPSISNYGSFRNSATRRSQTQHHHLSNHLCSFPTKNHEKYTRRKKKRRKIKKEEITPSQESEDSGSEWSEAQSLTDESGMESELYHFTGALRKGKR